MATNYAALFGIRNHWAPILFAVLYFFIFWYYVFTAVRRHSAVYGGLAFFSLLRIIAFSLRAAMAHSNKDAMNRGIAIAFAVLYNVGFFSLLLSAYNLLHNREKLAKVNRGASRFTEFFHRGQIVHILLFISVILGVVGTILLYRGSHPNAGRHLSQAYYWIFFVVALIIALLTLAVIRLERALLGNGTRNSTAGTTNSSPIGAAHHHAILLGIATLLLLRTLFFAITYHLRKNGQYNEHLWYPLGALPELLIVLAFLVPGLVPLTHLLGRHHEDEKAGLRGHGVGATNAAATNTV